MNRRSEREDGQGPPEPRPLRPIAAPTARSVDLTQSASREADRSSLIAGLGTPVEGGPRPAQQRASSGPAARLPVTEDARSEPSLARERPPSLAREHAPSLAPSSTVPRPSFDAPRSVSAGAPVLAPPFVTPPSVTPPFVAPSGTEPGVDERFVAATRALEQQRLRAGTRAALSAGPGMFSWRELILLGGLAIGTLRYAWVELDAAESRGPPIAESLEEDAPPPTPASLADPLEDPSGPLPSSGPLVTTETPPDERDVFGAPLEALIPSGPPESVLILLSEPLGAEVRAGDVVLGYTPLVLSRPTPVGTPLEFRLSGYQPAQARVEAIQGGRRRAEAQLRPEAP